MNGKIREKFVKNILALIFYQNYYRAFGLHIATTVVYTITSYTIIWIGALGGISSYT